MVFFPPIHDTRFLDADGKNGTAAVPPGIQTVEQLAHPGGACAVFAQNGLTGAVAHGFEHIVQLFRAGDDYAGADDAAKGRGRRRSFWEYWSRCRPPAANLQW